MTNFASVANLQMDAEGKLASARTISSPWPILARTLSSWGDNIRGTPFRITMILDVRNEL